MLSWFRSPIKPSTISQPETIGQGPDSFREDAAENRYFYSTPVIGLALLILVLVVFLPFGFGNKPLVEEWIHVAKFDQGIFQRGSMDALRPLVPLAHLISYLVDPNSLIGYNILLAVLFFARGFFLYLFLSCLIPRNRALAFLTAVLFILYPADTGLFSFRAITIQLAVVFWLIASYNLLLVWRQSTIRKLNIVIIWFSLVICFGIYEAAYPLVFLTPLLLIWLGKGISRKTFLVTALWLIIPVLSVVRQILILKDPNNGAYQSTIVSSGTLIAEAIEGFIYAYKINLYFGWRTALTQIDFSSPFLYMALTTGVLSGLLIWFSMRLTDGTPEPQAGNAKDRSTYIILLLIGLSTIGLGFAVTTITVFRFNNWRVFMFSSAGSALVFVVVSYLLSHAMPHYRAGIFSTFSAVLVSGAMLFTLNQHQSYVDYSSAAQQLLGDVVAQVPQLKQDAVIVVLDNPNPQPYQAWMFFYHGYLKDAFQYIYHDYSHLQDAHVCETVRKMAQQPIPEVPVIICQFSDSGVDVYRDQVKQTYEYSELILFSYSPGTGYSLLRSVPAQYLTDASTATETYQPCNLISTAESWPPRALGILDDRFTAPNLNPTGDTAGC